MTKRYILAVALLVVGGMIYLCSRVETLLMFSWCEGLGVQHEVQSMRHDVGGAFALCPDWVRFSLPNGLWVLAGLLLLDTIWGRRFQKDKVFWLAMFWFVAMGSEFGQGVGLVPGTFDWNDVAVMALATIVWVGIRQRSKEKGKRVQACSQVVR